MAIPPVDLRKGGLAHQLHRELQRDESANPGADFKPRARDRYSDDPAVSGKGPRKGIFKGRHKTRHDSELGGQDYSYNSRGRGTPHDLQGRTRSATMPGDEGRIMKDAKSTYEASLLPESIYDGDHKSKGGK